MKNRIILIVVALAVLLGAWWYFRGGGSSPTAIALLDLYPDAEKRSSIGVEQAFALVDVTIDDASRRAIFMHPTSRLTFKAVTIPRDAWLRTWVALRPEVWDRAEGDGVLFRLGVSDGRTYDELVRQHVDPQHNRGDRRWIPLEVDLSSYAGLSVDLIFNTNSSLPGRGDDPANDWAVWASPEVYLQR
jgi:hypothetical protein